MSFSSRSDPYEQYRIACDAYDLAKSTRSVTPVYKSRHEHALMECRQVELHKIQPCDRAVMYSMMGESILILVKLNLNEGFTIGTLPIAKSLLSDLVAIRSKTQRCPNSPGDALDSGLAAVLQWIFQSKFQNLTLSSRDQLIHWLKQNCLRPISQLGNSSRATLAPAQASLDQHKYKTRFHRAIEEYERGRFLQVKDLLSEYVSALDVAADRQSASSLTTISDTDLTDRLNDYQLYIDLCSGLLRLENGDRLLKRAMEGADGELEDFTYAALLAQDEYSDGYRLVAEKDLEAEGLAWSKMGHFQLNILKNEEKAHNCYLRALQMAGTLTPVIPKGHWYNECKKAVEERRNRLSHAEACKWENRRKPVIEALSDQLAELKDKAKEMNCRDSIAFLFNHEDYKPKTAGSYDVPKALTIEDPHGGDRSMSKIDLLKSIARYHPDKNMKWRPDPESPLEADDPDARYSVLCEEITKILVGKYGAAFDICQ